MRSWRFLQQKCFRHKRDIIGLVATGKLYYGSVIFDVNEFVTFLNVRFQDKFLKLLDLDFLRFRGVRPEVGEESIRIGRVSFPAKYQNDQFIGLGVPDGELGDTPEKLR